MNEPQRICSLLPSATEILYALGLENRLVGVSHECDFPPQALLKPQLTSSLIDSHGLTAREIDEAVRRSLDAADSIYDLDRDLLESLEPDLILTQDLCHVCAVGTDAVAEAISSISSKPTLLSLEPQSLEEVLDSILLVGCRTGRLSRAIDLVDRLRGRLEEVRTAITGREHPRVLTLEWLDPPFAGGHWVPEMVEIAGGFDVLGVAGQPSREIDWSEIAASEPEIVIAMPCGFGLERSIEELQQTSFPDVWHDLPAVQEGRVFVVDGSAYFNRPGPRLVEGVEILAAILHPETGISAPRDSVSRLRQPAASLR